MCSLWFQLCHQNRIFDDIIIHLKKNSPKIHPQGIYRSVNLFLQPIKLREISIKMRSWNYINICYQHGHEKFVDLYQAIKSETTKSRCDFIHRAFSWERNVALASWQHNSTIFCNNTRTTATDMTLPYIFVSRRLFQSDPVCFCYLISAAKIRFQVGPTGGTS